MKQAPINIALFRKGFGLGALEDADDEDEVYSHDSMDNYSKELDGK
jgi:hypothetical protein